MHALARLLCESCACAAPAAQAAPSRGGASHGQTTVPSARLHALRQPLQLTPAQQRERQEQEELAAALKVALCSLQ